MNITNEDFKRIGNELSGEVPKVLTEKGIEHFNRQFALFKERTSLDHLIYCLEKLVDAELDHQTAGRRGLGRASEHTPRLGAYFRKAVSKLPQNRVDELEKLISTLMIKSYLAYLLPILGGDNISDSITAEELYEEWVPQIYAYDLEADQGTDILWTLVVKDYENVGKFFKANGMKPGLFGTDKTNLILTGYATAGVVLALAEAVLSKP